MWCLRFPAEPGRPARECWYDSAVEAFEAYGEVEPLVRFGRRPWAELWSPGGELVVQCEAPPLARAERMVERAFAG
jgi:hypothetical protein